MGVKDKVFRWWRKFLLKRLQVYWRSLSKLHKLDEQKFYDLGRWTGILNALDENSPHVKKTYREVMNWYLYGMRYVRSYVQGAKDGPNP